MNVLLMCGRIQAMVIIGNSFDVTINSLKRFTPAGRSLYIVNGKASSASITIADGGTGASPNQFKGGNGDFIIGNGGNLEIASIDAQVNGYSLPGSTVSGSSTPLPQPAGFVPSKITYVTLNSDAPNNWNPTGFNASTQILIIQGNSSDVKINNLLRSTFANGQGLLIMNDKGGSAKLIIEDNSGGGSSNRFRGADGDMDVYRGGTINVISSDDLNRWSMLFGKV